MGNPAFRPALLRLWLLGACGLALLHCQRDFWGEAGSPICPDVAAALRSSPGYAQSFSKGGAVGCLRVSWEGGGRGLLVRLNAQGVLAAYAPQLEDFRGPPQWQAEPSSRGLTRSFAFFAFGSESLGLPRSQQSRRCENLAKRASYTCEGKADGECWFALFFQPQAPVGGKASPVEGRCRARLPQMEPLPREPPAEPQVPDGSEGGSEPRTEPSPEPPFEPAPEKPPEGPTPSSRLWLWKLSSAGTDAVNAVAVDPSGDVYLCGSFSGEALFGAFDLRSAGSSDIFIAKADSSGAWMWVQRAGGTGADHCYGLSLDAKRGQLFVAGSFQGSVDFGAVRLTGKGGGDIFVARLDSKGRWSWASRAGSDESDRALAVAADGTGGAVVVGSFERGADFGSHNATSQGSSDGFVASIDDKANWKWVRAFGDSGAQAAEGVALDSTGLIAIVGGFTGALVLGDTRLTATGGLNGFVAQLDATGKTWRWARRVGDAGNHLLSAVAIDSKGELVLAGQFQGTLEVDQLKAKTRGATDLFVLKLGPNNTPRWLASAGSKDTDMALAVALDRQDAITIAGHYRSGAEFGSLVLRGGGSAPDAFAARLSPLGQWLWAIPTKSTGLTAGNSIAVDPLGQCFLGGRFQGTLPNPHGRDLVAAGGNDGFLWKFKR